jgi:hypothetical protein
MSKKQEIKIKQLLLQKFFSPLKLKRYDKRTTASGIALHYFANWLRGAKRKSID